MTPRAVARTRPARGGALAVGAVVVILGLAHAAALRFVFDDAYISFRYAENLAHGHGLVFNLGERVEGYTNFLWTLLAALVVMTGGDPATWSIGIGLTSAGATLAVVLLAGGSPWRGVLAATLLASSTCWAVWATSGLETSLYTLLVTAGVVATILALEPEVAAGHAVASSPTPIDAARDPRFFLLGGFSLGLACLTRPDGLLIVGCVGMLVVWRAARGALPWRDALAWASLVAVCVLPHMAWRLHYYGQLLPNTFAIKTPGVSRIGPGLRYLFDASIDLWLVVLLAAIAAALLVPTSRRSMPRAAITIAGVVLLPYLAYVATTGGDFMPAYRFVAPVMPLIAWVSAAALVAVRTTWGRRLGAAGSMAIGGLVVVAYVALNLAGSARQLDVWSKGELVSVGWAREQTRDWLELGARLAQIAAPTDTLATTAAGAIPYRSHLYTIDMLGLNAPDLSKFRRRQTDRPGHTMLYDERWLDAAPPQILLAHPLVLPTTRGTGLSLDLLPEWRERVLAHYEVIVLQLPGDPEKFVGCALRRDVLARLEDPSRALAAPR